MRQLGKILLSAKELWRYYVAIGIFTILVSASALMQPLLSGWAIGDISKGKSASLGFAVFLAIGIFLLDFLQNIFNNIGGYLGDQMSTKLNFILSRRYFEHLLNLPQSFFDRELSGKLINRLNRSINQITNFIQMMSNNFLQFLFTTIFALAIVAYYSWQVALMLFALYPIYIFMTVRTSGKWSSYQEQKNHNYDIASGRFAEAIGQIKVVKSYIQQGRELSIFKHHYGKVNELNAPQSKFWHKQDVMRRVVLNVIFFAVYLYIFVEGVRGVMSPGEAVALILYGMQIRTPIITISMIVQNTQRAISDSRDYYQIMNTEPDVVDVPSAKTLVINNGEIIFDSVNFGYSKDSTVLKNISFTIDPNCKVALVGESGEGKSTLTNLLLRLYDVTSGKILIDGQNISQVTQDSLRSNIGVVFQEPALFSGTIRENISYANNNASYEDIVRAAKAANADEFISKFEKGYDTEIGERGLKLSGGQKQRIAIARALLKNPPILILDEATSSLDSKSEHMVQQALEHLMKDRTTLIIAHRLSTISQVDKIITLKNGTVDEIGAPRDLAKSGGIYSQLLNLQHQATEAGDKKLKEFEIAI